MAVKARAHSGGGVWPVWLAAFVLVAWPAAAQTRDSTKWEIELHGGRIAPANPAGGTVSVLAPGREVQTSQGKTRRVPSWYFGDGATLFNQVAAARGVSERITGLDPVLGRPLAERRPGWTIGGRVSHALSPRIVAELTVDYGSAPLRITAANRDAIEAARASFASGFNGMLKSFESDPFVILQDIAVGSTSAVGGGDQHQVSASAAFNFNLLKRGRLIPYATVGAGVSVRTGEPPSTTLTGHYLAAVRLAAGPVGGFPSSFDETDIVTLGDRRGDPTVAALLGGGMKFRVAGRWGLRVDIRAHLTINSASTRLDAGPDDPFARTKGIVAPHPFSDPEIVFGGPTAPANLSSNFPSLSGAPITGLRIFSGNGVSIDTEIATGIFWRF